MLRIPATDVIRTRPDYAIELSETILFALQRATKTKNPIRRFCLVRDSYWNTRCLLQFIQGNSHEYYGNLMTVLGNQMQKEADTICTIPCMHFLKDFPAMDYKWGGYAPDNSTYYRHIGDN